MCHDASDVLLQRLAKLPLFHENVTVSPEDTTIHQAPMESAAGVWQPHALNECWRILQYDTGGHFSPHVDAEYHAEPGCKSLRTFMIYLNDVPSEAGGGTCFISAGKTATGADQTSDLDVTSESITAADEDVKLTFDEERGKFVMGGDCRVRLKVKPEAGMALVFNHNMLHMGEELSHGEKWCMRTDMMYTQVRHLLGLCCRGFFSANLALSRIDFPITFDCALCYMAQYALILNVTALCSV